MNATLANNNPPGSLYRVKGRFYWRVDLGDGRGRQSIALKAVGAPFATREKRVAEAIRRRLWSEFQQGATPERPATPAGLIADYEAYNRMSASARQAGANHKLLERFFAGRPSVQAVSADDVQRYLQALSADKKITGPNGKPKTLPGLSPATVTRHRNAIRKFYRWAARRGLVETNPADLAETPRVYHRPPRYLDRPARRQLLKALRPGPVWLRRAVLVALTSGLRLGEIRALTWSAVQGRQLVVGDENATKTHSWRVVPLRVHLGPRGSDGEPVFAVDRAEVWVDTLKSYAKGVPVMFTRAGRGGVGNGWHLLRSTWATREARRGTSLWELMRLGGWVVPQTVMRYVSLAGGEMKTPQAVARGV